MNETGNENATLSVTLPVTQDVTLSVTQDVTLSVTQDVTLSVTHIVTQNVTDHGNPHGYWFGMQSQNYM